MNNADGVGATGFPQSGDTIATKPGGVIKLNLDGVRQSVGIMSTASGNPGGVHLAVTNGTLAFTQRFTNYRGSVNILKDGVLEFPANSKCELASSKTENKRDGGGVSVNVHGGGKFLVEEGASLEFYLAKFEVRSNGLIEIRNPNVFLTSDGWQDPTCTNNGDFQFPNGLVLNPGQTDSGSNNNTFTITQAGGTLLLGGGVTNATKNGKVHLALKGGAVQATENVFFHNLASAKVPSGANVTIDVAEGKTFDLSAFTVDAGATAVRKTGTGFLGVSPATLAKLEVANGGLSLLRAGSYDFSAVTFAEGAKIRFTDAVVTLTGTLHENVGFVADWDVLPRGVPFVTASADIVTRIYNDLSLQTIPSGLELKMTETTLTVSVKSDYVFESENQTVWTDASAWGGSLPPSDAHVTIKGSAVIDGAMPQVGSITLADGAKLFVRVSSNATNDLPRVALQGKSSLVIETGIVRMTGGFSSVATAESLPSLILESGAELLINQETVLKNIALTVNGTLEQLDVGHLTLGTADSGETAYFELQANGAKFVLHGDGGFNTSDIRIACPQMGGTVKVSKEMTMQNFVISVSPGNLGLQFGVNNPIEEDIRLVCKNSTLWNAGYMTSGEKWATLFPERIGRTNISNPMQAAFKLSGGATLVLSEGCLWEQMYNIAGNGRGCFEIRERGKLRIEKGAVYNQYTMGAQNKGTHLFPSDENHPSVEIVDGGIFQIGSCYGNGGLYHIEDGIVRLMYEYNYQGYKTGLFAGAKAIRIPEGKTATFCGVVNNHREHNKYLTNSVPIIGGGNLIITNAYPGNVFAFHQAASTSECTGSLTVSDTEKTSFTFLDGANWAGTVYAKNVSLDHGVAPVTNAFHTLHLNADFALKVHEDGGSDFLKIGDAATKTGGFTGDGKLVFTGVNDFDYTTLGKIPFGTAYPDMALPNVTAAGGLRAALKPHSDGSGLADLLLRKVGFMLIVR